MSVDFGRTARDYARYRTAFPPELFARLRTHGIAGPASASPIWAPEPGCWPVASPPPAAW